MNDETYKSALPTWLANILPEPRPPYTLSYTGGKYIVTPPVLDGHDAEPTSYDDVEEAYDHARRFDENNPDSGGLLFSSSLPELDDDEKGWEIGFIFLDSEKGFGRMLLASTDKGYLDSLISTYKAWEETYDTYIEDPNNFLKAYYFLNDHPCFWVKSKQSLNEYSWEFSGHAQNLWFVPFVDEKDGKTYFMMEAGSHVAPDYTEHYHDLRLDTYADSYENVIIKTAKLVHKFFHKDGSEQENVECEKSDLQKHLDETMERLNLEDDSL